MKTIGYHVLFWHFWHRSAKKLCFHTLFFNIFDVSSLLKKQHSFPGASRPHLKVPGSQKKVNENTGFRNFWDRNVKKATETQVVHHLYLKHILFCHLWLILHCALLHPLSSLLSSTLPPPSSHLSALLPAASSIIPPLLDPSLYEPGHARHLYIHICIYICIYECSCFPGPCVFECVQCNMFPIILTSILWTSSYTTLY